MDQRSPSVPCGFPDPTTTEVPCATAATVPVTEGASAGVSSKRGSQGLGSSSDDDDNSQGTGFSDQPLLTLDFVQLCVTATTG